MKKAVNALQQHKKKAAREQELAAQRKKENDARQVALEDAKKIIIEEDTSLPKAKKIRLDDEDSSIKLHTDSQSGTRVQVFGRAQHIRKQKDTIFITLRDGYGKMQCVLSGKFAKTYDAITLTQETSLEILGELWEIPAGASAPLNRELHVDYFKIDPTWKAPGGDDAISTRVAPDADPNTKLNLRHLTLRGDTASSIMIVRDAVEFAFNTVYRELRFRKVSPPALVQTQVEGGSTLFEFQYYDEKAYVCLP